MSGLIIVRPTGRVRLRELFAATAVSDLANGVFAAAGLLIASQLTRSSSAISLVSVAGSLPLFLLAIPAGLLVDSFHRARLISVANVARGLVMLVLGIALEFSPGLPIVVLAVVVFAAAAVEVVVDTAAEALTPEIVPRERLSWANGLISLSARVLYQFGGPLLAGLLIGGSRGLPALVAAGGCLGAAFILGRRCGWGPALRGRPTEVAPARTPVRWGTGVRIVAGHPGLATLTVVGGITTLANYAFITLFVLYATAPGPLGLSSVGYGLLVGAIGLGAGTGAVTAAHTENTIGLGNVLWVSRLGWALVFLAPIWVHGPLLVVPLIVGGALGGMWAVVSTTVRQRTVAGQSLGQVSAAVRMFSYGMAPAGAALGGVLGEVLPIRVVFAGCATLVLLTIVPLRLYLSDRQILHAEARAESPDDR